MNVWAFSQQVDRSGQHFYREMALRARGAGVKQIFTMLAQDEERLLARRRRLRARFGTGATAESTALEAASNVYDRLRAREDEMAVENDLAAYNLALEAQRQVVQQYQAAADRETRPDVKQLLVALTEEERRVLDEIEHRFDFANAPNAYLAWGEFSNLGEFHNFGRDVD